jgi:tricarballylate dehydrogenase
MIFEMILTDIGAWLRCHAVCRDSNAPEFGDLVVGDNFQKRSRLCHGNE